MGVKMNARKSLELSTQPLVFRIDDTLTKEGYGADSKAVGEAIEELKNNSGGVQADWNETQDVPSFIKNKTHYENKTSPFYCSKVENLPVGITMLADLSNTHATPINNNLGHGNIGKPDYAYLLKIPYTATFISSGKVMSFTYMLTSQSAAVLIDTKNYYVKPQAKGNFVFYVIADATLLTEEYKAKFPNKGVYVEVLEIDSTMTYRLDAIEFKVAQYMPLDRRYIPTTIARQDALTALEARVAALEAALK